MENWMETVARLLQVSVESLQEFTQDTLDQMEAIVMLYDLTNYDSAREAYDELDKLWQKEVRQKDMREITKVIGYSYEFLCSLDEQTQLQLMYTYALDKSNLPEMYDIVDTAVVNKKIAIIANLLDKPLDELMKLPERTRKNLSGVYNLIHDEVDRDKLVEELTYVIEHGHWR